MSAWQTIKDSFGDMPTRRTMQARTVVVGAVILFCLVATMIVLTYYMVTE